MKFIQSAATVLLMASLLLPFWARGAQDSDAYQITAVMKMQFDRPDAPLAVEPVTVEGDYAVAGWIQGKKGGRALLQKEQGQWRISVCGGDGLTQAKVLETTGMHPPMAQKLAVATLAAEAKLSADKRRLFASFEGTMKIDAASAGPGRHHAQGTLGAPGAPAK